MEATNGKPAVMRNRITRKQIFWLSRFLNGMKADIELGKYTANELASLASAQIAAEAPSAGIEKVEWKASTVKEICQENLIAFVSKRPASGHGKSGWARRMAKNNERFEAIERRLAELETQLGIKAS